MFDIFRIGFLNVTLLDLIDIAIVTFIIYKLYTLLRGTIAAQIFLGLLVVLFLSFGAQLINLKALSWLLKFITDIWIIAFIILFQPEIRRLLVFVAKSPFLRFGLKSESSEVPDIVTDAAFEMAQFQHGALIVLNKSSGIRGFSETGELLNAKVTKNLLRSIFYPRSPLHDGAVIIKNDIVEAARATLPLSTITLVNGETLGMRHRAGLGISEVADVISVIVSEETGSISVADDGKLYRGLSRDALRNRLLAVYRTKGKPIASN
ncbi:MAG: TIGR00159 family protein [Ignavibacteriales bacterium]|nr:Cyclic di-AMP synthase CdaA [Ignavibacteriaceae bacterium]MCK6613008.1 diadenylate cyclase CdaA [Ignavibacteriaceae bacterium]QOJ29286.1 MAG: TIGR00159 family protein [Ignavibacteriales bacterium]